MKAMVMNAPLSFAIRATAIALVLMPVHATAQSGNARSRAQCAENPERTRLKRQIAEIKASRRAAHDAFIATAQKCIGASACLQRARAELARKYEALDAEQKHAVDELGELERSFDVLNPEQSCAVWNRRP